MLKGDSWGSWVVVQFENKEYFDLPEGFRF